MRPRRAFRSAKIVTAQRCARKNRVYATSQGIRTAENRDGGRTRGNRVLRNVPKEVISFRTAVRVHTRIALRGGTSVSIALGVQKTENLVGSDQGKLINGGGSSQVSPGCGSTPAHECAHQLSTLGPC